MGVPAHLIASTLNISVAQRLVRKLCQDCKEKTPVQKETFPIHFITPDYLESHYIAKGCSKCYHTGYNGRKAIYELLPVGKELAVHIKHNELQIDNYMKQQNIKTLSDQALFMVLQGETSVDEVFALLANH